MADLELPVSQKQQSALSKWGAQCESSRHDHADLRALPRDLLIHLTGSVPHTATVTSSGHSTGGGECKPHDYRWDLGCVRTILQR